LFALSFKKDAKEGDGCGGPAFYMKKKIITGL